MIWLVNVLFMLAFSHVVGVSTPDEAPPVDCDALDNWLPAVAMATDSSLQQRRARFAIHPTLRQYTIGHPISGKWFPEGFCGRWLCSTVYRYSPTN